MAAHWGEPPGLSIRLRLMALAAEGLEVLVGPDVASLVPREDMVHVGRGGDPALCLTLSA